MKKMRGVVDPISLGIAIILLGVGAVSTHTKKVDNDQLTQNSQQPVVQVVQQTKG